MNKHDITKVLAAVQTQTEVLLNTIGGELTAQGENSASVVKGYISQFETEIEAMRNSKNDTLTAMADAYDKQVALVSEQFNRLIKTREEMCIHLKSKLTGMVD